MRRQFLKHREYTNASSISRYFNNWTQKLIFRKINITQDKIIIIVLVHKLRWFFHTDFIRKLNDYAYYNAIPRRKQVKGDVK